MLYNTLSRIYDKAGEGFITMDTLRGLISELLAPLTEDELGKLKSLDCRFDPNFSYITYIPGRFQV